MIYGIIWLSIVSFRARQASYGHTEDQVWGATGFEASYASLDRIESSAAGQSRPGTVQELSDLSW